MMNTNFWEKFPQPGGLNCLEVKEKAQMEILNETKNLTTDNLIKYFKESSNRFWAENSSLYQEADQQHATFHEPNEN